MQGEHKTLRVLCWYIRRAVIAEPYIRYSARVNNYTMCGELFCVIALWHSAEHLHVVCHVGVVPVSYTIYEGIDEQSQRTMFTS